MLTTLWYWQRDGACNGPVTWDELQALARTGKLRGSDRVMRLGESEWQLACAARHMTEEDVVDASPADAVTQRPRFTDAFPAEDGEGRPTKPLELRSGARMLGGALLCAAGIGLTAMGYSAAAARPGGGRYFIFYGAIIAGAFRFFVGLIETLGGGSD